MVKRSCLIVFLVGAFLAVHSAVASAYSVSSWTAGVYSNDYSGPTDTDYYTQAGGHPYEGVTDFTLSTSGSQTQSIRVDLPPGLISNPQGIPKCTDAQFPNCPSDTQVGVVELSAWLTALGPLTSVSLGASVYNMVPPAGDVSDFAFDTAASVLTGRTDVIGGVRSASDDGLYFTIAVPSVVTLQHAALIFWGVPGDSAHDPDRGWSCVNLLGACTPPASSATHDLSGEPFITLPSGCVPAGQVSTVTVDSYQGQQAEATSATPVAATGCAGVPFQPSLTVTPQTTQADAPSGVAVDLHVPQNDDAADLSTSTLRTAAVTLPPGMTLDPSAANGLQACSPGQFGNGSDTAPTCPAASQVGTAEIETPLLAVPLTGSVYLGCDGASSQTPCPASGGLADLYVYATGDGVTQKLVGTVTANSQTGQLTTTFADLPQVPFSDFKLDLRGGATAPLANPLACGRAVTSSALTPYSGNAAATPTSSFVVDANGAGAACPQSAPFTPTLAVKPATTQAGAYDSPVTFTLTRADRQQYLNRIAIRLPTGLLAMIARVAQCPGAQAAAGTCPSSSLIGSVSVVAGAGSDPITQTGNVYLTGPYAGGPFGLSMVVPAVAGPFDLGTVLVRAAIDVNRDTAQLTVSSDPLPQVVGGVPLRIRAVAVTIDRSGFVFNPTSCAASAGTATLASTQGASATATSPFQATGCGALRFSPALAVSLSGRGQTRPGGHPQLTATVTSRAGQSNIRSAAVTLPLSLALDPNNSMHVCSVAKSNTDTCPANTKIGTATVDTPVLNGPLSGPVYLVQGFRTNAKGQKLRTLPALLVTLRGQVALDLHGQTSVGAGDRLVTTFPAVPDAPISRFTLHIGGGHKGVLVVTGRVGLCRHAQVARAVLHAQSGPTVKHSVKVATPCARGSRR